MCLGIPAKVIEIKDFLATVDMMGNERNVGIHFVPEVQVGDYVLVHAGYAMEIIDEEVAKETAELLLEVEYAGEEQRV